MCSSHASTFPSLLAMVAFEVLVWLPHGHFVREPCLSVCRSLISKHCWPTEAVYLFDGYNKNKNSEQSWTYLFNNYSYVVYHRVQQIQLTFHVYSHLSCWAHGVLDQCGTRVTLCVCVCFSMPAQSLCCGCVCVYLDLVWDPYMHDCVLAMIGCLAQVRPTMSCIQLLDTMTSVVYIQTVI